MSPYVTVFYVKCKTKKCGEVIAVEQVLASAKTRELTCRRGHTNKYGQADVKPRNVQA